MKQWEEWKEKDSELVLENYEQDLENAIMLSKLDYEEKKELYKQLAQESSNKNGLANKKRKNKVMSLEEFLGANQNAVDSKSKKIFCGKHFFITDLVKLLLFLVL